MAFVLVGRRKDYKRDCPTLGKQDRVRRVAVAPEMDIPYFFVAFPSIAVIHCFPSCDSSNFML